MAEPEQTYERTFAVGDHAELSVVIVLAVPAGRDVHHADPQGDADLGGRHPDGAGAFTHRVEQVLEEAGYLGVDDIHRSTDFFEDRVRVYEYFLGGHLVRGRPA